MASIAAGTSGHRVSAKGLRNERLRRLRNQLSANPMVVLGGGLLILLSTIAIAAPMLTQYGPLDISPANRLAAPDTNHWFGTDNFGRDLFSRVLYGARVSLGVGAVTAIVTSIAGLAVGLCAAYYSFLDHILMRICDGLMAFPAILLAIAIMAALGPQTINVVIALVIVKTPTVARVVRSSALTIKEQTYVEALRAQGAGSFRILWRHIAPNTVSPLIVQITYVFAVAIIIEAALSFLGAGVPAPDPSWGNILYDGKVVIFQAWWMTVFPGIAIVLGVLGLNLFGDGLRDVLDPQSVNAR